MQEYIYCDNGKYYRELTDLLGKSIHKEEITEEEYNGFKKGNNSMKTWEEMKKDIEVKHAKQYVITEGQIRDLIHMLMGEEEAEEKIYIDTNHGIMEIENVFTNETMTFSELTI